jgi:hypothetical protein
MVVAAGLLVRVGGVVNEGAGVVKDGGEGVGEGVGSETTGADIVPT